MTPRLLQPNGAIVSHRQGVEYLAYFTRKSTRWEWLLNEIDAWLQQTLSLRDTAVFAKLKTKLYNSVLCGDLMRRQIDNAVLEMALVGFNAKHDEVVQKMADIERQLGVWRKGASAPSAAAKTPTAAAKPKRKLSAAGKRAIRAALQKRWAAFHAKTDGVKPAKQSAKKSKRTMSPAIKARLVANLAKARAAKAKKRATHQLDA